MNTNPALDVSSKHLLPNPQEPLSSLPSSEHTEKEPFNFSHRCSSTPLPSSENEPCCCEHALHHQRSCIWKCCLYKMNATNVIVKRRRSKIIVFCRSIGSKRDGKQHQKWDKTIKRKPSSWGCHVRKLSWLGVTVTICCQKSALLIPSYSIRTMPFAISLLSSQRKQLREMSCPKTDLRKLILAESP